MREGGVLAPVPGRRKDWDELEAGCHSMGPGRGCTTGGSGVIDAHVTKMTSILDFW